MSKLLRHPRCTAFAALAAALALAAAAPAAAHQCVEVEILRAPDVAQAGGVIHLAAGIANCGDPVRGIRVSLVLVGEDGDRHLLARGVVHVPPGGRVHDVVRALIPGDVRPGRYRLVLVGQTPSGFTDRDASPLFVRPAGTIAE